MPEIVSVHISDDDLRARLSKHFAKTRANVADALDGDGQTLQRVLAKPDFCRCADTEENAKRGPRRRIAAGAIAMLWQTGDVARLFSCQAHIVYVDADVFGRDVMATQRIDGSPERAEQLRRLGRVFARENDGFAAAKWQACDGILVGHAARQPQYIGERVFVCCVLPAAATTGSGAERG